MKKHPYTFVLAYSSLLLQANVVQNLGFSGEGQISRNTLQGMIEIASTVQCLKGLIKLFYNSTYDKSYTFVFVMQQNSHWSHCNEKSSFVPGLHYGHYKSRAFSTLIYTENSKYSIHPLKWISSRQMEKRHIYDIGKSSGKFHS